METIKEKTVKDFVELLNKITKIMTHSYPNYTMELADMDFDGGHPVGQCYKMENYYLVVSHNSFFIIDQQELREIPEETWCMDLHSLKERNNLLNAIDIITKETYDFEQYFYNKNSL